MTEAETKTIVGTCDEISEKNGFTTFHINVGTQYPERLSTKLPALIEAGRAVGQDTATWTFKQSQGKENPNRPGTYYQNKYLDKVEIGEHAVAADNTSSTVAPQRPQTGAHEPVAVGDKDRAITRMACLKAASELYAGLGQTEGSSNDPDAPVWSDPAIRATLDAAARFEMWVYRDIDDVPFA